MAIIFFFSAQPDLSSGLGVVDLVLRKIVHFMEYGAALLPPLARAPDRHEPGPGHPARAAHRLGIRGHRRVAPDVRRGPPRHPGGLADRLRRSRSGRRSAVDARATPARIRRDAPPLDRLGPSRCWSSRPRGSRWRWPGWPPWSITRYDGWENTALVIGGLVVPWSLAVLVLALRNEEAALGPLVMGGDLLVLAGRRAGHTRRLPRGQVRGHVPRRRARPLPGGTPRGAARGHLGHRARAPAR